MSRQALGTLLLLSVGIHLGVFAALGFGWLRSDRATPGEDPPPVHAQAAPEELPPAPPDEPQPGELRPGELRPGEPPPGNPPPRGREMMRRHLNRLADRLELEGERRERFLTLQERFFEATHRGRRAIAEAEARVRRELVAPEPDPRRVEEAVRQLGQRRLALDRTLAETVLETRALLSGDQEAEYLRFLERVALRRGGARGAPGPGGRLRGELRRRFEERRGAASDSRPGQPELP